MSEHVFYVIDIYQIIYKLLFFCNYLPPRQES